MDSRERQVKICHIGISCFQTVPGKTASRPPELPTQVVCICEDGGACWCPRATFYLADENIDGYLMLSVRHFHVVSFNEAVASTPCMFLCPSCLLGVHHFRLSTTDSLTLHLLIPNTEQIQNFSEALTQQMSC